MSSPASPTRSFVALAYAAELLATPELLEEYGRAFGADDDVTLAIFAPGVDGSEVAEALAPHADTDADLLLLALQAADAPDLAESVDYVYTRRAPLGPFAALPHTGEPAELRRALDGEPSAPAPVSVADRLVADRAQFHRMNGAPISWHNGSVLAILESHLRPGMRTLETGSGHSTVVFAASGCEHTAITPAVSEAHEILAYCREHGYPEPRFLVGRSQDVLPTVKGELDVVYVDGAHAFPFPIVDWWYASELLRVGGLMLVDDTDITSCFLLLRYMTADPHWEAVSVAGNHAIFRKTGDYGRRLDPWAAQPFSAAKIRGLDDLLGNLWPEQLTTTPAPAPVVSAPALSIVQSPTAVRPDSWRDG